MINSLICGLPRSGTSFLYKISIVDTSVLYLNETNTCVGMEELEALASQKNSSEAELILKSENVLKVKDWILKNDKKGGVFWKQPSFFPREEFLSKSWTQRPLNLLVPIRSPRDILVSFQRRADDFGDKWDHRFDAGFGAQRIKEFMSWLVDLFSYILVSRPNLKLHLIGYDFIKNDSSFCSSYSKILGLENSNDIHHRYEKYEKKFQKKTLYNSDKQITLSSESIEKIEAAMNLVNDQKEMAVILKGLSGFDYFSKESIRNLYSF